MSPVRPHPFSPWTPPRHADRERSCRPPCLALQFPPVRPRCAWAPRGRTTRAVSSLPIVPIAPPAPTVSAPFPGRRDCPVAASRASFCSRFPAARHARRVLCLLPLLLHRDLGGGQLAACTTVPGGSPPPTPGGCERGSLHLPVLGVRRLRPAGRDPGAAAARAAARLAVRRRRRQQRAAGRASAPTPSPCASCCAVASRWPGPPRRSPCTRWSNRWRRLLVLLALLGWPSRPPWAPPTSSRTRRTLLPVVGAWPARRSS